MKKLACISMLSVLSFQLQAGVKPDFKKPVLFSIVNANPESRYFDCGTGGTPPTPKKDDKKDCGTGGTPPTPKKGDAKDCLVSEFDYYNNLFLCKKSRYPGMFDSLEEFDKLQK